MPAVAAGVVWGRTLGKSNLLYMVDMMRRSWNTFEGIVKEWAAVLGESATLAA